MQNSKGLILSQALSYLTTSEWKGKALGKREVRKASSSRKEQYRVLRRLLPRVEFQRSVLMASFLAWAASENVELSCPMASAKSARLDSICKSGASVGAVRVKSQNVEKI